MLGGAIRKEGLKQRQKRGEPIARERDPQLGIKFQPKSWSPHKNIKSNTNQWGYDQIQRQIIIQIQKYKYKWTQPPPSSATRSLNPDQLLGNHLILNLGKVVFFVFKNKNVFLYVSKCESLSLKIHQWRKSGRQKYHLRIFPGYPEGCDR